MSTHENDIYEENLREDMRDKILDWLDQMSHSIDDVMQDDDGYYIKVDYEAEDCSVDWKKIYLPEEFQKYVQFVA